MQEALLQLSRQRTAPDRVVPRLYRVVRNGAIEVARRDGRRRKREARVSVAEARTFVDGWKYRLQQLEYGSRRRTCDWNDTLSEEKEHAYEILLPDAQHMRVWGRLVALKARVEMAEGKLDECIGTLETGLAFAGHVAEGPFLINSLVGMAIAREMLVRVDELIARPDAPNLSWALTALPRPLIGIRKAFENAMKMMSWMFPELGEVDRPRTLAEWTPLLDRFHGRMASIAVKPGYLQADELKALRFEADPAKFRSSLLPEARAYLGSLGRPIEPMQDDPVLMLFFAGRVRDLLDDSSKPFYFPIEVAAPMYAAIRRQQTADKAGPLGLFFSLAPAVEATHASEARLDRKVAALRVVEAIRMQASSDQGKFPESLDKVIVVPVPLDPCTGKPFEYRRDGDAMVLSSAPVHERRLDYRITPRR